MRQLATILFWGSLVVISGCASLKPVPVSEPTVVASFNESGRRLPDAVVVAESLLSKYLQRADELQREERRTGLGLIGLGVIGADLATRSIAENHVLGLGLAGVGMYAAGNWSNPRPLRLIYIEGASALQCAIAVTEPLQAAYTRRGDLEALIGNLESGASVLDGALATQSGNRSPAVMRAKAASTRAKALIPAARAALARMDRGGGELYAAVRRIQVEVQRALAGAAPDFQTLIASLTAQKIFAPSPAIDQRPPSKSSAAGEDVLDSNAATLESSIHDIENILDLVNARPATTELNACHVDTALAGITMRVDPGMLTVSAGTTRTALASGGVPPYLASWFGAAPSPDEVELRAEANGVILIAAKAVAAAGQYSVLVTDNAKGRERLEVTVQAASSGQTDGKSAGSLAPTPPACVSDPTVKAVQQALRSKGVVAVTIDGKDNDVVADGCMGPITIAAMRKFQLEIENISPEAIPADSAELLKQTAAALGVTG